MRSEVDNALTLVSLLVVQHALAIGLGLVVCYDVSSGFISFMTIGYMRLLLVLMINVIWVL